MEVFLGVLAAFVIWWFISSIADDNDSGVYLSQADNSYSQASKLNPDDQLAVFGKLARDGHASALASFTWHCLEQGRHAEAIALYNETRMSLTIAANNQLGWELANCDSNQALNLLATGASIVDAKVLWDRNVNMNHVECIFYSNATKVRAGIVLKTDISRLPMALKREMRATLTEGTVSTGWYKSWCKEVLADFGDVL